ncbi:FecR family protein [Pedobacter mucosus]|uniref:FecR family protein n=1 Tax=Pedobacter mucosus TaxID=2895286 RepID=UPI001EE4D255|nr:FecR domain-containing protein [Pedobacter mucosus]UKT63004.1 FecR domain-containing protein [Pedobacter mucosus]
MVSQNKNPKAIKSVFKKYLKEKATSTEHEAVNSWYEGLGKDSNESFNLNNQPEEIDNLGRSIKEHLIRHTKSNRKLVSLSIYIKYAAIFLLIVSAALTIRNKFYTDKLPNQERTFKSTDHAAKEITLTDGSIILLNVGSELIVAKNFGSHERNVSLKGEAFFKIAKNKLKPFIIKTGALRTTVVGTSFNINAYADLNRIKISVASGKVRVSKKTLTGEEILATSMTRDASLSFEKSTGKTLLKIERCELISSWKDSKLYIDNATLSEIAKQLERYYHLKVVFNPKIDKGKRYTIRFNQEPANRIMEILSMLTKTKFTYQTKQITII